MQINAISQTPHWNGNWSSDLAVRPRRILVLSPTFPASVQPTYGVFVKERIRAISALQDFEVHVVAPIPFFPPIRLLKRWYTWSQFPRSEVIDGITVDHPRYFMIPRFGHSFQPRLMQRPVNRLIRRLVKSFAFDLIDAHYVYPAGVVAARLSVVTGKPFVVTGRGEDMCRFPRLPALRRQIEFAVARADHCIAVSQEIAAAFVECGASPDKVTVIGNGVDCKCFHPANRLDARKRLKVPAKARLVVSVGDRFENKGFHLLIQAVRALRTRGHDIHARIVGGAPRNGVDFTPVLQRLIRELDLEEYVHLVGRRPHAELTDWYNAADVLGLFSEREGSPNVLLEALACGVPAVATAVGEVPDILADGRLGLVVKDRSVESIAEGLSLAFDRQWSQGIIRAEIQRRDWHDVSKQVTSIFDRVISCRTSRN